MGHFGCPGDGSGIVVARYDVDLINVGHEGRKIAGDSSSTSLEKKIDIQSPIIYYYLTFGTELPQPSALNYAAGPSHPPPQPDLSPFVSPFLWSKVHKNVVLYISCVASILMAYRSGSYEPQSLPWPRSGLFRQRQFWLA